MKCVCVAAKRFFFIRIPLYDSNSVESKRFFIAVIYGKEKMSKTLNKCITSVDSADKGLLILLGANSGVSPC